jgi:nicotinic acid mononucleotide adenylyltransferase
MTTQRPPESSSPLWAVYGGAFDPFHLGHRLNVRRVLDGLWNGERVSRVLVVPTYAHAFGKDMTPFAKRLAWAQSSLIESGLPRESWDLSPIERSLFELSRTPSFTIDTLDALAETHPRVKLKLVVGPDIRAQAHRWRAFDRIERDYGLIELPLVRGADIGLVGEDADREVRATTVRERLSRCEDITAWVGPAVARQVLSQSSPGL